MVFARLQWLHLSEGAKFRMMLFSRPSGAAAASHLA
jgi:hypothetical protein